MKYIDLLVAIISGVMVLTYIFVGFDFLSKDRLIGMTKSLAFLVFLYSAVTTYHSFKKTANKTN